jgi:hypothetical protein
VINAIVTANNPQSAGNGVINETNKMSSEKILFFEKKSIP